MNKSTIKEILGTREWKGDHGTVFYIQMLLDNGEKITLGKKKSDAFKVGDTVCYEVVEEGKKWKEVKENPFVKKTFNSESNNRGAMVGMSYKLAFELVYKGEDDFQKAVLLANAIFDQAMITYGEVKEEPKDEEKSDLPF